MIAAATYTYGYRGLQAAMMSLYVFSHLVSSTYTLLTLVQYIS